MSQITINGGKPLTGRVDLKGSKNLVTKAMVAALLATAQPDKLQGFFDDPIHQPFREKLIPGFNACMQAGRKAGAHAGWISGSGSTLMWLATKNVERIGEAIHKVMPNAGLHFLKSDNSGLKILEQNRH